MQDVQLMDVPVREQLQDYRRREEESGYFQLKEGANYFGRDAWNDIVIPVEDAAHYAGILFLNGDQVLIRVASGQKITHDRKLIDNVIIFGENTSLILEYRKLRFKIIHRDGRYGLAIFR
jgi:hypothetical protein